MPLDHLSLVARRTAFLYRTIIIAKTVLGRLLYTGHYTDSRLKHIPSLSVKKRSIYLSWNSNPKDRLQVCHTSRGYRGTFREHRQENMNLEPSLGLATAPWNPKERVYTFA